MNMKKLAATALTLTMALAMSTPVYATWNPNDITSLKYYNPIEATYEEGVTTTETVYSVDVEWGKLEYTYHPNATKKWDPTTLKYVVTEGTSSWDCEADADKIKVTNHSNEGISANFAYEKTNAAVNGTFDQTKINLKSAEKTTVDNAPTETATLTLSGDMAEDAEKEKVLGSVTVTIGEFEGTRIYDQSTIIASNIPFYTTGYDNIVTATGTFSYDKPLDLVGLKIGGTYYNLPSKNTVQWINENETIKTLLEAGTNTYHGSYKPKDKTVEYRYVLTINLETKELIVTATANS